MRFFPMPTRSDFATLPQDIAALIAAILIGLAITGWIPALPKLFTSLS